MWASLALLVPPLAWSLRKRSAAEVTAGVVRRLGLPPSLEEALEPRPPGGRGLIPRGLLGTAFLIAAMIWSDLREVRGILVLSGVALSVPALLTGLGVRRRLRRRVAFKLGFLAATLLLLLELVHLLAFTVPMVQEGTLFDVHPVTGTRNRPGFQDARTTIDEFGFRCPSVPVPALGPDHTVVLILGGSTAFGWLLEDADTLGPLLEEELRRLDVRNPVVLNASTAGWYSWNELCYYLCEAPRYPLDAVVFFHGRNDLYWGWTAELRPGFDGAHAPAGPHQPRAGAKRSRTELLRDQSLLGRLLGGPPPAVNDPRSSAEEQALAIARLYAGNMEITAAQAVARQLPTLDLLQPIPYAGRELLPAERARLDIDLGEAAGYWQGLPHLRLAGASLPDCRWFSHRDLSDALDRAACPGEAYIDECHYTPTANRVLAARMAEELATLLRRSDAPQPEDERW